MKHKFVLFFLVILCSLTLMSCSKLEHIKDYEGKLYKYNNETSFTEFIKHQGILDDNQAKNSGLDFETITYSYEKTESKYFENTSLETNSVSVLNTYETKRVSFKNHIIQKSVETNKNMVFKDLNSKGEENSNTLVETGMQELDSKMVFYNKQERVVRKSNRDWTDVVLGELPQTNYMLYGESNARYYVDNNIYTVTFEYIIDDLLHSEINQVVVSDNRLTKLVIKYVKPNNDSNNNKIEKFYGYYMETNFKEQKLSPCKLKDFTRIVRKAHSFRDGMDSTYIL